MYLTSHHYKYLIPVVEARLKSIKKKIVKEFGSSWGDYDDDQIDMKVTEKNDEYYRLKQVLKQMNL